LAALRILGAGAVAAAISLAAPAPAQTPNLEYAVKAAYLYKFAPFVEWPDSAFASPTSPMVVCIAGDEPFGPVLARTLDGKRAGQRPVVVRKLSRVEGRGDCHVLYLAGSKAQSVGDGLAAVRGTPVLTVTDSRSSGGVRGIVHFVIEANRVRFQIDEQAAARNGLSMSSKLLSLALSVKPRGA
jgi:hypothetical protein